tara:strand:- start:1491 stop:2045 length:555 start_codon:yes stop_codon:yes gene_type:complete
MVGERIKSKIDKISFLKEQEHKKKYLVPSDDFEEFLIDCKMYFNSQSYGPKIEKRWREINKYKKIKSTENRGDYKDGSEYTEFKVSYFSEGKWSLLQLRPYQSVDRYDILLAELGNTNMKYTIYKIPKDKMKYLIDKYGEVAHGTKRSNSDNKNLEYRITIKKNMLHEIEPYIFEHSIESHDFF